MSRNFELMTQLGLEVGAADKPQPDATGNAAEAKALPVQSGDGGNVSEEEMARFLLEMYPGVRSAPKQ